MSLTVTPLSAFWLTVGESTYFSVRPDHATVVLPGTVTASELDVPPSLNSAGSILPVSPSAAERTPSLTLVEFGFRMVPDW